MAQLSTTAHPPYFRSPPSSLTRARSPLVCSAERCQEQFFQQVRSKEWPKQFILNRIQDVSLNVPLFWHVWSYLERYSTQLWDSLPGTFTQITGPPT